MTKKLFMIMMFASLFVAYGQDFVISGSVTDQNNQPLPGASISEKGTSNGTVSDFDGNFEISVADHDATLIVSYIGFATREIR